MIQYNNSRLARGLLLCGMCQYSVISLSTFNLIIPGLVAMGMLVLHSENQREPGLILISVAYECLNPQPKTQTENLPSSPKSLASEMH